MFKTIEMLLLNQAACSVFVSHMDALRQKRIETLSLANTVRFSALSTNIKRSKHSYWKVAAIPDASYVTCL